MTEPSLWSFISHASPVVKLVMVILLFASIASWTIILQRVLYFKRLRKAAYAFEKHFWTKDTNLSKLYSELPKQTHLFGLARIFQAGFKEFQHHPPHAALDNTQRAMRVATTQEIAQLEKHLGFLATVGSTSPYIGLFGTVWGIMSAFRALGVANQATIAMVAPGIAEALIATAIGLFAAIPAVIAYNRLSISAERIASTYETFQEELTMLFDHNTLKTQTQAQAQQTQSQPQTKETLA